MVLPAAVLMWIFGNRYWVPNLAITVCWWVTLGLVSKLLATRLRATSFHVAIFFLVASLLIYGTEEYGLLGEVPGALLVVTSALLLGECIVNVADGAKLKPGSTTLKGIAFDGGKGIKEVTVSTDGGKSWTPAKLGKDLGKYSFREWKLPVKLAPGSYEIKVRATNNVGDTQPMDSLWNPAGYLRNVVETVRVTAA